VNDEVWKKHRSALVPGFHHDNIQHFTPFIVTKVLELIELWDQEIPKNDSIELKPWIQKFAFDSLMLAIFDVDNDNLRNIESEYFQLFNKYRSLNPTATNRHVPRILHYLPIPNLKNLQKVAVELRTKIQEIIQERKKKSEKRVMCFMDCIMDALTPKEVEDNVYGFMIAGHGTISNALIWGVHFLAQNPEAQEKARAEIDSILGGKVPELTDLSKFKYLDMVIKENLRLGTPTTALVPRAARDDIEIENVKIRKNDGVNINLYALHHHPDFWENPFKYDPERFSEERSKGRHPYSYMPFSHGKRSCLGTNFSQIIQKVLLIMLLQKYVLHGVTTDVKLGNFCLRTPLNIVVKISPRSKLSQ